MAETALSQYRNRPFRAPLSEGPKRVAMRERVKDEDSLVSVTTETTSVTGHGTQVDEATLRMRGRMKSEWGMTDDTINEWAEEFDLSIVRHVSDYSKEVQLIATDKFYQAIVMPAKMEAERKANFYADNGAGEF